MKEFCRLKWSYLCILFVFGIWTTSSADFSFKENKSNLNVIEKNSGELRSKAELLIIREPDYPKELTISINGLGRYDEYIDVSWETVSKVDLGNAAFKVRNTQTKIFDKEKKLINEFKKDYDYEKNLVQFTHVGIGEEVIEQKTYEIDGPVCDEVSLVFFVQSLIRQNNTNEPFYLVTNEPKMYKVRIFLKGDEVLFIENQRYDALKVQLFAGMGPWSRWISKFVAPTFVWYENDSQKDWLKYEGLESGFHSAHIITIREK